MLYHVFIDFKKTFDRAWLEGLWRVLHHYGFKPKLVNFMQNLYNNTKRVVIVGKSNTEWFKQTDGVRQGCALSPDLFNNYLEHVMCEALKDMEYIGASILTLFR